MPNKNFYSLLDRPATEVSPSGSDIYKWSYLDPVGNLKTDKKNVYEEIQSYKNSVDYKKKIEQGETFENGNGIYLDTTKFSGDYGDFNEYLAGLASAIRSQVNQNKNSGAVGGTSGSETPSQVATPIKESGSDTSRIQSLGTSGNGNSSGSSKLAPNEQGTGQGGGK